MDRRLHKMLQRDPQEVAPLLLGCRLTRKVAGAEMVCRIVETEAYSDIDAASHSFKGRTPRTEVMFGPPGKLYVYFTYGMHYCCNVVVGREGQGAAVLIRAVEPLAGMEIMRQSRGGRSGVEVSNGPAKVCQALQIDRTMNGHDLSQSPLLLERDDSVNPLRIVTTTRIGISKDIERPWRFYIKDNPYISRT